MQLIAFSCDTSFRDNYFLAIVAKISNKASTFFVFLEFYLVNKRSTGHSNQRLSPIFSLHASRSSILPIDSFDVLQPEMREIMHSLMRSYNNISSFAAIPAIRRTDTNPLIGVIRKHSISTLASNHC